MDLQDQLLAIERRLWTNDAPFYEANLTDEALLVFSETGVITRDAAVAAIRKENAEGDDGNMSSSPTFTACAWPPTWR